MLKMQKGQEDRHLRMSKAIFAKMKAGSAAENHERLVGLLSQVQMRRLP
jgi:hypothetical protein